MEHYNHLSLEHIWGHLDMLSLGHLSPSIVASAHFLYLLLKIQSGLLHLLRLPAGSANKLWYYYTSQDCVTWVVHDRLIALVFLLPQDRDIYFEAFQIIILPMLYPKLGEASRMIACYKFEFENLNMAMFRFILLDWDKLQ